jgi:hypothetical protein
LCESRVLPVLPPHRKSMPYSAPSRVKRSNMAGASGP